MCEAGIERYAHEDEIGGREERVAPYTKIVEALPEMPRETVELVKKAVW